MSVTPAWHTRPIFITSTFRDMHMERDYLRTYVFPELEERIKARRTHLEPIDLRWGVETVTKEEEHAKEMLVLKVCLAKVERSRPFLIGLIGDRYGWIPPEERMVAAAREAGFKQSMVGVNLTYKYSCLSYLENRGMALSLLDCEEPFVPMLCNVVVKRNGTLLMRRCALL